MESERITSTEAASPQWLGSVARRADHVATQGSEPVFTEEQQTQWLGSVARRNNSVGEAQGSSAAWTGSSERSALFSAPMADSAPETAPVVAPVAPANVHELAGRERIVMGALGMTLRVAA